MNEFGVDMQIFLTTTFTTIKSIHRWQKYR